LISWINNVFSSKLCASEVNVLSDRIAEFRAIHTEIVACSVDSHLSHLAWSKTPRSEGGIGNPKIPIIADPTHAIAKDYGVLVPERGHSLRLVS
jgi:peroxiredoxin (alkyl hydroperoxide reductase subunit C)